MSAEDPCALDDTVMLAKFQQIVKERGITCIVETGIHHGLSTIELARMVPTVFAIDNNIEMIAHSAINFNQNEICAGRIVLCLGNSPKVLQALKPLLPPTTLYFLDAHWQSYWPLLDEIRQINPGTGVIVMHDIQVPDHPELLCDSYNGHTLNYDYVKDALSEWSPAHVVEYNERAEGTIHLRGVMYVYPE